MPHLGRNKNLKAEPENNPSRFTREKAQRTLDEVRKRYGIRQSDSPAHLRANTASSAPREPAKQQPRPSVSLEPPTPKTPFVAVERMDRDRIWNSEGFAIQVSPQVDLPRTIGQSTIRLSTI
jgi:hypothetical protein